MISILLIYCGQIFVVLRATNTRLCVAFLLTDNCDAAASLRAAESAIGSPLYVDTLGLSEEEKRGIERNWTVGGKVDPVISYLIGATAGLGYVDLIGRLGSYPIPEIPVGNGNGELFARCWIGLGPMVGFRRAQGVEGGWDRSVAWRNFGSTEGLFRHEVGHGLCLW